MLFNTFNFILILPIIIFLYCLILAVFKDKSRMIANGYLRLTSYLFYFVFATLYLFILIYITLIAYTCGLALTKISSEQIIILACLVILLPLLYCKYSNFIISKVNDFVEALGIDSNIRSINIIAPLGISFFTFLAYGYVYDVCKHVIKAKRNIIDFSLFLSFVSQIASCPIGKAGELSPQIKSVRSFNSTLSERGFETQLWGYFLKVVLADRVALASNVTIDSNEIYR